MRERELFRNARAAFLTLLAGFTLHVRAQEHRTPRAGEAVTGTLFGRTVSAPARDRRRITFLNAGAVLVPSGPEEKTFGPSGGLYLWRTPKDGESRLRAILVGIFNEVRWDLRLRKDSGLSLVLQADTLTLPWARSEYDGDVRLAAEELEWHQARAGVGLAWRTRLAPDACDNGLDMALTLEPGVLWFRRGPDTAPAFVPPTDTFEGRLHLRVRADAVERNLLELPHSGWSAGADVIVARRSRWEAWGLPPSGLSSSGRDWLAGSLFALAAFAPPGPFSERHRLIASAHAGLGSDLDRFSAFRLGSGSTWGDFETLSRLVLPGAGMDEVVSSRYAILDLEYRYEALFFLYLQARGTLAWAERGAGDAGLPPRGLRPLPAISAGLTSGLPWDLSLEAAASYSFGLERSAFLISLTREF